MAELQCPTADYILSMSGKTQLSDIKSLELSDLELDYLDAAVFQQMTSLTILDLSNNHLKDIPGNLGLPNLVKLDVAGNFLSSATFVQQFPKLRELYLEGNNVEPSDKYIAASMCPSIVMIDKMKKESFTKMLQRQRDLMKPKVMDVWEDVYGKQYIDGIPDIQEETVAFNFIEELKDRKLTASSNFQKYADYLVSVLARELIQQVQEGDYEPPPKRLKVPRSPIKGLRKPEKLGSGSSSPRKPGRPKLNSELSGSPRKPLSCQNSPLARTPTKGSTPSQGSPATKSASVKPLRIASPRSANSFTNIRHKAARSTLAAVPDYDPVHFIRCHSGGGDYEDDDPEDNETQIWACAFEPPSKKSSQSSVVATCGGNTVCLIDCNTGRITKRMRQSEETFYTIAWTTLPMCSDGRKWTTNVLAVSGIKGRVLLVHPDQLVCYTDFTVCSKPPKYVGSMIFHPTQPTKLFCGDFRGDINVWDIGLPTADKEQSTPHHLMTLKSDATNVLTMLWSETTGHLVAGCEGGCFAWKINSQNMKKSQRNASTELVFSNKEKDLDGMCLIAPDLVACKLVKFGCIYVWRLSTTLRNAKAKVKVQPFAELEWQKTKEVYMNMMAKHDLLVSGDDQGSLWLYNSEMLLRKHSTHAEDVVFRPSRILLWPECNTTHKRDTEAKMTDLAQQPKTLVVNDVAVSADKEFIVAGMDNNMVAIWRREPEDDEDEEDMDTD